MNETHFVYSNALGCHDFIHLHKVCIPVKETYTYRTDKIIQRNEIRIVDYLRDKGVLDTNVCDRNVLDNIMTVRRIKDKQAFLNEIYECHGKYYKEVRIVGVTVRKIRFVFDVSFIDKLNNVLRLCTKKAKYSIDDTYSHYKNKNIVVWDAWMRRDACENYSPCCWFMIEPKIPAFACGNVSVTIPPICVDKDGLTFFTKFLDLNNFINRCEVFVDVSLFFQRV